MTYLGYKLKCEFSVSEAIGQLVVVPYHRHTRVGPVYLTVLFHTRANQSNDFGR